MELPDWARAHGAPLYAASIRSELDDFAVTEELGFDFSGDGEHHYLFVEKRGANTEWVSRQLAAFAGVAVRDIGYAGLKDRHAVARQWFSVPGRQAPVWEGLDVDGVQVLETARHRRKLRRGAHSSNRFSLVLRGETPDVAGIDRRLAAIAERGVPNYFGEQRFGRGGSNLALADAWSDGRRLPRHKKSLAISTVRSFLFNQALDVRVRDGTWDRLVAGDTANLDGSGSLFAVDEVDEELRRRCRELDIHPAGVLPGEETPGALIPDACRHWHDALARDRVRSAARSLRLRIRDLDWARVDGSLRLEFGLGRGAFATSVLREIADIRDAAAARK